MSHRGQFVGSVGLGTLPRMASSSAPPHLLKRSAPQALQTNLRSCLRCCGRARVPRGAGRAARREPSAPPSLSPESPDSGSSDMAHVSSSRSPPSWPRSMSPFPVHVVEKSMLPAMHYARMLCVCVVHAVGKAVRVARVTESQAERAAQARVRAARHTDLPLLLARAAEQGATAAGGDSMI